MPQSISLRASSARSRSLAMPLIAAKHALPPRLDRADDRVAGFLGEPGLHAVGADVHRQQRVAVALGDLVPGEIRLRRSICRTPDIPARCAAPSMASSRTVTTWPSAGRPVEFLNTDFVSPSARARSVISSAKFSSDPAMPSAMTMQPSLADCTTTPWIRSSSRICRLQLGEHRRAARLARRRCARHSR